MGRACRAIVLLAAWGVALAAPAADAKRPITEKDLFRFTWAADPQISPDGSRVAFVRVGVNKDKDTYETGLWLVPTDKGVPRRLTNGPRDAGPRWSPDGKHLVFVRSSEKEGKPQPPQLFLLSLAGGEPRALTTLPKGAASPVWSPDGKKIVFLSSTTPEDMAKQERTAAGKKEERESDVRVITRAEFRLDNAGYADPAHPAHLWTVSLPASEDESAKPRQLTHGHFDEGDPAWSPDGARLYFLSTRKVEPYHHLRENQIYYIPSEGGERKRVTGIEGAAFGLSPSPDGRHLAFRGVLQRRPVRSYTPPDLFVADATPGAEARNLTAEFDYDVGGGLTGDQHPPRGGGGSRPVWDRDGAAILDIVAREGRCNLMRFDVTSGKATPLTEGDQEVMAFTACADRSKRAMLVSTTTSIGDVFLAGDGGYLKRLTHLNDKLFGEVRVEPPEEIWYDSFDGKKIHAWVQKPADFDPKKKYPLILDIHGGPHAAYGHTFFHEFHCMAARGYVVLYPNPRGSSSYGADFGNVIQYRYPGDDYKDLMAGVEELIRRGYVDPKRMGVTGGSGGGLLTNWVITQTDRFAAAVSQRSISDWSSWWYTADFTLFHPQWFKSSPFQDPAEYAARSPLTYVKNVKTPLMLIEGESDYRTPPGGGGEPMFRALKYLKKPVVMVQFPGESHELSRSGKPWHRVERLEAILNWFDKYLQGKPMPQYDLPPEEEEAKPGAR